MAENQNQDNTSKTKYPYKYSIILPVYNEVENIPVLLGELQSVMGTICQPYEILAIDDGSTDGSYQKLKEISQGLMELKIIRFRKNSGKAAVLSCGFSKVQGEIVFTMDADLQDDPKEITKYIEKLEEGNDVVIGWKFPRLDPITKTLPSKVFNGMVNYLCNVKLHDINCGYKAYKLEVIKNLKVYGGRYRFLPVFAKDLGYQVAEIKIIHRPRTFGKSKYGSSRFVEGFFDLLTVVLLTRFKKVPLHFFGFIGILFAFTGFLCDGYLAIEWLYGHKIGDRPLLLFGVLLILLGVQLLGFGLIGEIIVESQKNEPTYLIRDEE